ncbi:OTU domain-containing protein [Trichonephila clavipes]|nr:OTU domain-containing protein [Trichonephila clavipes]
MDSNIPISTTSQKFSIRFGKQNALYLKNSLHANRRLRRVLGQFGIYGQVINVPIEANTMVNSLPRNIDDDHSITVHIKRKKIHKSNYLCGYSQQKKNKKAWLQHLKDSPLYTSYGITVDDSFFNGQDDIQDEIIYDEDGDNDISEQIPIDESFSGHSNKH